MQTTAIRQIPAIERQTLRHIPTLDGLRGMAILLVISVHYFGFISLFSIGWSGVDLFFVLSGYLITGRLLDSLGQPGYFRNFYRNRILRIFPVYYGTLILFYIGIRFCIKPATFPFISYYLVHWKSFFFFTENWTFINFGMPLGLYLMHFWSLAVEEQFYLFWPSLLFLLKGTRARMWFFITAIVLILAARCILAFYLPTRPNTGFYYYNTLLRMDSFVIGALLRQLHYAKIIVPEWLVRLLFLAALILVGLSPLLFTDLYAGNPFFATVGYTLVAIFYACLLHWSVQFPGSIASTFFKAPVLRFFGKISYGMYIFHIPVLMILQPRFQDWEEAHWTTNPFLLHLLSALPCFLITFFVSRWSYRYFESRFLRLKKR